MNLKNNLKIKIFIKNLTLVINKMRFYKKKSLYAVTLFILIILNFLLIKILLKLWFKVFKKIKIFS
jgi:hypothetical protein